MEYRAVAVKLKIKPKPKAKAAFSASGPVSVGSGLLPGKPRQAGPTSQAVLPPPTGAIAPFDPNVEARISARAQQYGHTLAGLAGDEARLKQEFDPSNPMGRQALLKNAFQQTRGAQHINQASSGQLYSGSSATEDAFTNQDEGYAQVGLANQFQAAMDAITGQRQRASDETILANLDDQRSITTNFAGDPLNTPVGAGLPTKLPKVKASPAEMKARVKARLLAQRKAKR